MKKILAWAKELLIALIILTLLLNLISFIKKPELASNTLPEFNLTTTTQKQISSDDYSGKALLIHFWATWCPACKLEASNIERLSKSYQVITIAVNSGSDDEINLFLKEHDLNYDVINDSEGEFASKFSISSFPTTFIYDKNGEIKFSEVGYTSTLGLNLRMWLSN
jgi:thiol-disulfide isomerase/thioredoxin